MVWLVAVMQKASSSCCKVSFHHSRDILCLIGIVIPDVHQYCSPLPYKADFHQDRHQSKNTPRCKPIKEHSSEDLYDWSLQFHLSCSCLADFPFKSQTYPPWIRRARVVFTISRTHFEELWRAKFPHKRIVDRNQITVSQNWCDQIRSKFASLVSKE